jgi:8-oxo-dGTP pyrophosphatase MutT (NUDIX family)
LFPATACAIITYANRWKGCAGMKEISAGGVVYRRKDGRVEILGIEDRFGHFTLPKGKMEPGETVEETALREIREETGISGRIIDRIGEVAYRYTHAENGEVDKQVHYFLVEAAEGKETPLLEEIRDTWWLSPEEAWKRQRKSGYRNNDFVFRTAYEKLGIPLREGDER